MLLGAYNFRMIFSLEIELLIIMKHSFLTVVMNLPNVYFVFLIFKYLPYIFSFLKKSALVIIVQLHLM